MNSLHAESSTPAVEVQQAERFLTLLDETAEAWCFRTFAEASHASGGGRNYTGALSDVATSLQLDNGNGRGVFVVVNEGGQDADSITRVRAVFADFDPPKTGAMPATFPIEPHLIVESSPGHHHVYWLVDGLPCDEFTPVQRAIIGACKSDPSVCDKPRVMRLPGFMHRKGEPSLVRIIHESGALPYSADVVRAAFKPAAVTQAPVLAVHAPSGVVVDTERHGDALAFTGRMAREVAKGTSAAAAWEMILAERDRGRWTRHVPNDELRRMFEGALDNVRSGKWPVLAEAANDSPVQLTEVDLTDVMGTSANPPRFVMPPIVPRGVVTLLGGHGGLGKTMLGLTFCAHVAADRPWGPVQVEGGKAVFISLEDDAATVLWRLHTIIDEYQLPVAGVLANLRVFDGTDLAPELMRPVGNGSAATMQETPLMEQVTQAVAGATLTVVDNASESYGGNVNDPGQVKAFMRRLKRIAKENDAGLILLAHVDKASAKFGSRDNSYVGTAAWHNSARSRLALVREDGGALELRHEKSNLGPKSEPMLLRHADHGVLVPLGNDGSRREAAKLVALVDADAIFEVLKIAIAAGQRVNTSNTGQATAWHALSLLPELGEAYRNREGRRRVGAALAALERSQRIHRVNYRRASRHVSECWEVTAAAMESAA